MGFLSDFLPAGMLCLAAVLIACLKVFSDLWGLLEKCALARMDSISSVKPDQLALLKFCMHFLLVLEVRLEEVESLMMIGR